MDFDAFYRKNLGAVYQLCLRLTGDPDAAAEAVQDAFVKAYKARQDFRGESAGRTWIHRIAYNAAIDLLRRRGRSAPAPEEAADPAPGPEGRAEGRERDALVRRAIRALPEEDRRLMTLMLAPTLSYADLARVVDCPEGAIRMRVCRARKRLRELLRPALEEDA